MWESYSSQWDISRANINLVLLPSFMTGESTSMVEFHNWRVVWIFPFTAPGNKRVSTALTSPFTICTTFVHLVTSLCKSGLDSLSGIWQVILSWIQASTLPLVWWGTAWKKQTCQSFESDQIGWAGRGWALLLAVDNPVALLAHSSRKMLSRSCMLLLVCFLSCVTGEWLHVTT